MSTSNIIISIPILVRWWRGSNSAPLHSAAQSLAVQREYLHDNANEIFPGAPVVYGTRGKTFAGSGRNTTLPLPGQLALYRCSPPLLVKVFKSWPQASYYSILASSSSSSLLALLRSILVWRVLEEEKHNFITNGKRLSVGAETGDVMVTGN